MTGFFFRFPNEPIVLRQIGNELDYRGGLEAKTFREALKKHLAQFGADDADAEAIGHTIDTEGESDPLQAPTRRRDGSSKRAMPAVTRPMARSGCEFGGVAGS